MSEADAAALAASEPGASSALAPWLERQLRPLLLSRSHALLLQGPSGLGQFDLGLALVRAWLCESRQGGQPACGHCASCHAIDVKAHADLNLAMPETVMLDLGWPLAQKAQEAIDNKERKPSREIRVDAMRDTVVFAQRTSARGQGKAVFVYPAERMNTVTANALLKTLEEPSGDTLLVLASESAGQLLPTLRSRCVVHTMAWPGDAEAVQWLVSKGLAAAQAPALLRAAGARPQQALALAAEGIDAKAWAAWPQAIARGDASAVAGWTPARLLDGFIKLCHDLMAVHQGAAPRFFAPADLPRGADLAGLSDWAKELYRLARHAEHPFSAALLVQAWTARARRAITAS